MQDRIEARLKSLTSEYRAGQQLLADLEARKVDTARRMIRIRGAIEALTEVLTPSPRATDAGEGVEARVEAAGA